MSLASSYDSSSFQSLLCLTCRRGSGPHLVRARRLLEFADYMVSKTASQSSKLLKEHAPALQLQRHGPLAYLPDLARAQSMKVKILPLMKSLSTTVTR